MDSLAIVIPYRDRADHLREWAKVRLKEGQSIVVVEQCNAGAFNRGKLLNIGFLETSADLYLFNDVDMIPKFLGDHFWNAGRPVQLAKSTIQTSGYFGGSTLFGKRDFIRCNGFNNTYDHRAEDNEMWFNLKRLGIEYSDSEAEFEELPHPRPLVEFDPVLWRKAQEPRPFWNGLSNTTYEVLVKERIGEIQMLKVTW